MTKTIKDEDWTSQNTIDALQDLAKQLPEHSELLSLAAGEIKCLELAIGMKDMVIQTNEIVEKIKSKVGEKKPKNTGVVVTRDVKI